LDDFIWCLERIIVSRWLNSVISQISLKNESRCRQESPGAIDLIAEYPKWREFKYNLASLVNSTHSNNGKWLEQGTCGKYLNHRKSWLIFISNPGFIGESGWL